jgi:putative flippase GtrA
MFKRILVFSKAQVSAFTGGVTDYLFMIFLTEFFHVHYTISILFAGALGSVVNFSLNKRWAFRTKDNPYKYPAWNQFLKFVPVVLNSIVLKSSGTYFITSFIGIDYKISRIMADFFVAMLNFILQKYWVFRKAN